ncbi:peptidase M15, partial [Bacteroides fragilis]
AADITVGSKEGNRRLFEIIRKELPFDQLIDEKDFSWVHVSFRKGKNRKQVLKL